MRVRLKGLKRLRKRLANGSSVEYFYAWKGGPRLPGKPGSPEFVAAYNAAIAEKVPPRTGVLSAIFNAYESSSDFAALAESTKGEYRRHLRLGKSYCDFPIAGLTDRRARSIFLQDRDAMAERSTRAAHYRYVLLARVLSWALDRGLTTANPLERIGRVHRGSRRENVWTDEQEAAFHASAPEHLHLALMLALWTGQRQGDLLRLPWGSYNVQTIRLRQSKTVHGSPFP